MLPIIPHLAFVAKSRPTLCYPRDCSPPDSSVQYWKELPFPFPGDLPNPGIEPRSSALWAVSLLTEPPGKPILHSFNFYNIYT